MPGGRITVLDALRGAAITLMLLQHSMYYLYYDLDGMVYGGVYLISRLSAPLFLTILGYCIALSAERRMPSAGRWGFARHALSRAAILLIAASALNLLRFDAAGTPNILHLLIVSILMTSALRIAGNKAVYAAVFALFIVLSAAPAVAGGWELVNSWLPGWYSLAEGYAIGPWQFYAVFGLGLRWLAPGARLVNAHRLPVIEALAFLSILSMGLGIGVGVFESRLPYTLILLAGMAAAYQAVSAVGEIKALSPLTGALTAYGRHPLPLYMAHQAAFATAPRMLEIENTFGPAGALAALSCFLLAAYAGARALDARAASLRASPT